MFLLQGLNQDILAANAAFKLLRQFRLLMAFNQKTDLKFPTCIIFADVQSWMVLTSDFELFLKYQKLCRAAGLIHVIVSQFGNYL